MRARGVLLSAIALAAISQGCAPDDRPTSPAVAHVTQATIDTRSADAVFGQPDFSTATSPILVDVSTVRAPAGIAVRLLGSPESIFIADRGANRVLERDATSFGTRALYGQPSYGDDLPNGGGGPTLFTLHAPEAIGVTSSLVAIADTQNHRVIVKGFGDDQVLGQHGSSTTDNRNDGGLSATSLAEPRGLAWLTNDGETRLFVADGGNHRVIGFRGGLTTASWLIGQGSFATADPNRGRAAPTANTLNDPHGIAAHDRESFVVDSLFGLWIADTGNHRVLHFSWCRGELGDDPCPNADVVLGQPDGTTATPGTSATALSSPMGVAVDPNGGVWVADTGNNRVVHFPRKKTVADIVLGQPDFDSNAAPTTPSATSLLAPEGVAVDQHGNLYVSDTGENRVLRYLYLFKAGDCDDGDACTFDFLSGGFCQHSLTTFAPECAPYLCDTAKHVCQTSCLPTTGCQSGLTCTSTGRCVQPCFGPKATCALGKQCVDGWCCDSACTGQCESCNVPGSEGVCSPIPSGRSPESFNVPLYHARPTCAAVNGGEPQCAGACDGTHRDACAKARAKTTCGYEACNDGVETLRGQCDGAGTCVLDRRPCGLYACEVGGCRKSCTSDLHCAAGAICVSETCVAADATRAGGDGCEITPAGSSTSRPFLVGVLGVLAAGVVRLLRRGRRRR